MAKKRKKVRETVIVIRIPDATSRNAEAQLAISRGEVGTTLQFPYRGLTLVGNINEAVKAALEKLTQVEANPPTVSPAKAEPSSAATKQAKSGTATASEPDEAETDETDASSEEAETENIADEVSSDADTQAAQPAETPAEEPEAPDSNLICPTVAAFCIKCGWFHQLILDETERYETPDTHLAATKCARCAEPLNETSIPLDVTLARRAYPLPDQHADQVVPAAENEEVRALGAQDATGEDRAFNVLMLHKLPDPQAALYMQVFQQTASNANYPLAVTHPLPDAASKAEPEIEAASEATTQPEPEPETEVVTVTKHHQPALF